MGNKKSKISRLSISLTLTLISACFFFSLGLNLSYAQESKSIGIFTAVYGDIRVVHPGGKESIAVKLRDGVFFKDLIETLEKSKTKILFLDDTILNVGEKTKIEITEHIFDPDKDSRSTIINLIDGKVRALVGRVFSGSGSKFEIHTPTAVAAARGSYGIVWVAEVDGKPQTGVLNLKGAWEVRNADPAIAGSIILKEGEFSQIGLGLPPALLPGARPDLVIATEVKVQRKEEAPQKEEIAGRDVSGETVTPASEIISSGASTTGGDTSTASVSDTTAASAASTVTPPIQQQPPPTTTPVHVEINF